MSRQIKTCSNVFEHSLCFVCGLNDVDQFFNISENYIEYKESYISLREILVEALEIKIDSREGKNLEVCLDCKDKVVKFYHFKRKAQEIQKRRGNIKPREKDRSRATKPKSKLVHNIVQIVENYAKKIGQSDVSSIKVDEKERKLIIEPKLKSQKPPIEQQDSEHEEEEEMLEELLETTPIEEPVNIKEEEVFCDPISYIDTNFEQDELGESQNNEEEEDDMNIEYNYEASTSSGSRPATKKRKTETDNSEAESDYNQHRKQVLFYENKFQSNLNKSTSSLISQELRVEINKLIAAKTDLIFQKIRSLEERIKKLEESNQSSKNENSKLQVIKFQKIKNEEELSLFGKKMENAEMKAKLINTLRRIPNNSRAFKELHGKVAVFIEYLFDPIFIPQLSWSEMRGIATNKTCLINHPQVFDLAHQVLAKKVANEMVYVDAEKIKKSFQHYFRHRGKSINEENVMKIE